MVSREAKYGPVPIVEMLMDSKVWVSEDWTISSDSECSATFSTTSSEVVQPNWSRYIWVVSPKRKETGELTLPSLNWKHLIMASVVASPSRLACLAFCSAASSFLSNLSSKESEAQKEKQSSFQFL